MSSDEEYDFSKAEDEFPADTEDGPSEDEDDTKYTLNDEAFAEALEWAALLKKNGYNLKNRNAIFDAAGFLVANGHSDECVEATAILLYLFSDIGRNLSKMFPDV